MAESEKPDKQDKIPAKAEKKAQKSLPRDPVLDKTGWKRAPGGYSPINKRPRKA